MTVKSKSRHRTVGPNSLSFAHAMVTDEVDEDGLDLTDAEVDLG